MENNQQPPVTTNNVMIRVDSLTKYYRNVEALKNLSLEIHKGDVFGFIGPNGAGKTTTIKILATLLKPTAGDAFINGYSVLDHPMEVRRMIGYMPDFFGVYDDMKVWEYLDFFAAAYKIDRSRRKQIIDDVLVLTDLQTKREEFVESLSRGMKQRLCLAKTLVHDPQVLLLDEPASGLDPRARIEMRELLKELRKMGKTILISSHILPELADFCNKIGIIEKGSLLASGDVEQIMKKIQGRKKIVRIGLSNSMETAKELLEKHVGVESVTLVDGQLRVELQPIPENDDISWIMEFLVINKLKVTAFHEETVDLEDIFMKITKGLVS